MPSPLSWSWGRLRPTAGVGAALLCAWLTSPPALAQGTSTTGAASAAEVASASENTAGAKGARTYCFMRSAGNTHKVSWDAAYALIKRQSASLFKTSPEHAAVMITEAVVNNPTAYPDCGKYLGDLYVK